MPKYRIPVRVITPPVTPRARISKSGLPGSPGEEPTVAHADDTGAQGEETAFNAVSSSTESGAQEMAGTKVREHAYRVSEVKDWREEALRLKAEMATYRRRQQRIARQEAQGEQVALLKDVLAIADNLDRTLSAAQEQPDAQSGSGPLVQGVEMTRSALQRVLGKQGLERLQVKGVPFDPMWHEAIHVVPSSIFDVEPGTVVEVLEAGYKRQGVLFRPAKVVVAQ